MIDTHGLAWPPQYVDINGEVHDWDDRVPVDSEAEVVDPDEEPLTYRELAYELCDAYGGIEDFLDHQWLHTPGTPAPPSTPAAPTGGPADTDLCEGCGRRPGEIEASLGWVCWPCYETDEYS